MKELEVTVRLRNNRLKQRREELGMSQRVFAAAVGVSLGAYRELEALRRPALRSDGSWREIALALAAFHCVEPEELFTPTVLGIEAPVAVRRLDAADFTPLLVESEARLLEAPDASYDQAELRDQVAEALASLRPREAEVLRRKYGLTGGDEQTLQQIGDAVELSREGVRQLERQALRRLAGKKSPLRAFTAGGGR